MTIKIDIPELSKVLSGIISGMNVEDSALLTCLFHLFAETLSWRSVEEAPGNLYYNKNALLHIGKTVNVTGNVKPIGDSGKLGVATVALSVACIKFTDKHRL